MAKHENYEDELDYEIEEIENDYGADFSQITKKFVSKSKKKHKDVKFKKDGYFDKNNK
jgi:hypothetical protein